MSPDGAAPSGGPMYVHLPNGQKIIVKYDDFSYSFRVL